MVGVDSTVRRSVTQLLASGEIGLGATIVSVAFDSWVSRGWLVLEAAGAFDRRCAVVGLNGGVIASGLLDDVVVAGSPEYPDEQTPSVAHTLAAAAWDAQRTRESAERNRHGR